MRRTHHDALQHGLPADEGFLAAFESWEQLDRCQKTQVLPQTSHSHWMLLRGRTTPTTTSRLPQKGKNYAHHKPSSVTSIPLCINRLPEDLWSDSTGSAAFGMVADRSKSSPQGARRNTGEGFSPAWVRSMLGLLNDNQWA